MTFIASVIAKKGVAIIADSLVTLMENVIETDDLQDYIESKAESEIDFQEIFRLAKQKPNYTKNYTEKLFQYDMYTAITTAGAAYINQKSIEELINDHTHIISKENTSGNVDQIVKDLEIFFREQAHQHLDKYTNLNETILYVTHFHYEENLTVIRRINIGPFLKGDYSGNSEELVRSSVIADYQKVVCDGQNGTSDRILFGDLNSMYPLGSRIIKMVFKDLGQEVPDDYLENFFTKHDVLDDTMAESLKIFKLNNLSLQQAVNLAALLMRIERDLQSFTENIPTVGGVIKMAVIDKEGFRMILGDKIETPSI